MTELQLTVRDAELSIDEIDERCDRARDLIHELGSRLTELLALRESLVDQMTQAGHLAL